MTHLPPIKQCRHNMSIKSCNHCERCIISLITRHKVSMRRIDGLSEPQQVVFPTFKDTYLCEFWRTDYTYLLVSRLDRKASISFSSSTILLATSMVPAVETASRNLRPRPTKCFATNTVALLCTWCSISNLDVGAIGLSAAKLLQGGGPPEGTVGTVWGRCMVAQVALPRHACLQ